MAALTRDRNTPRIAGKVFDFPMKGGTTAFVGGIAVLNGGFVEPGTTATGRVAVGVFTRHVVNAGADGAETARVEPDTWRFNNSASADEIDAGDIGSVCYIVDDQTVALTHATNTRSIAGTVINVDAEGVWVRIGV